MGWKKKKKKKSYLLLLYVPGMCVFFTLTRSFYPSTTSTTSVRADSSILEEIQVLWSQSYATEILRCHVCTTIVSTAVSGECNAMSSHWIRQARRTHSMKQRNERKQRKIKNKEDKSKEKKEKRNVEEINCRTPPPAGDVTDTCKERGKEYMRVVVEDNLTLLLLIAQCHTSVPVLSIYLKKNSPYFVQHGESIPC